MSQRGSAHAGVAQHSVPRAPLFTRLLGAPRLILLALPRLPHSSASLRPPRLPRAPPRSPCPLRASRASPQPTQPASSHERRGQAPGSVPGQDFRRGSVREWAEERNLWWEGEQEPSPPLARRGQPAAVSASRWHSMGPSRLPRAVMGHEEGPPACGGCAVSSIGCTVSAAAAVPPPQHQRSESNPTTPTPLLPCPPPAAAMGTPIRVSAAVVCGLAGRERGLASRRRRWQRRQPLTRL